MLSSFRVTETLCQAEIDDIDIVLLLPNTNQEVIWLDVTVKEMSGMYEFDSLELYKKYMRIILLK